MNKIKYWVKENKELFVLVGLLSIGVLVLYSSSWFNGNYFVGGGDVRTQTHPFFVLTRSEWISALKEKTLPFYCWYGFLGMNVWASKATYSLFDIYNFIGYLFRDNFWVVYEILCYLKIVVSGITFYLFGSYLFKNKKHILLASLCYGLSSYVVYFTSEPYFISFYSLAPLYFLGIEKYFKENKKILFIVMVSLLLACNYYFFFALSIITPIYFLYRYFNVNGSFKGWLSSALKLIGYYTIGACIVGVIIVPSFFYVMQNERVGNSEISFVYSDIKLYLHLLINWLVPSHTYIYGNNIYNYSDHTLKEILIYAGSIVSVLLPQVLVNKDKKYRNSTVALYIILALILFTPIGGSITNGLSETCFRWTYLIIFINCFTVLRILENKEQISKKILLITLISEVLLIAICYFGGIASIGETVLSYLKQGALFLMTIAFIALTTVLLYKEKYSTLVKVTFIELTLFAGIKGYECLNTSQDPELFEEMTTVLADSKYDLEYYVDNLDENNKYEFFRIYIPEDSIYWDNSYNQNILYGVQGLMSYDSMYSPSFDEMKNMNPDEVIVLINWQYNITDVNMIDYLSTKYSITLSEDEIPFENYEIVDASYRGGMITALNLDYKSFGQTYSEAITYEDFYGKYGSDTSLLNEVIICESGDYEHISSYLISKSESEMVEIEYGRNYMLGTVESDEDSFLILSLPYDEGWKILVNGQEITKYKVNGGTIGIPVEAGTNSVEMYFVPRGFKTGAIMTVIGTSVFIVIIIVEKRKKRV